MQQMISDNKKNLSSSNVSGNIEQREEEREELRCSSPPGKISSSP